MGTSWGDICEGVRVEVPNTDSGLPMKVYWIAGVIKLAGEQRLKTSTSKVNWKYYCLACLNNKMNYLLINSH